VVTRAELRDQVTCVDIVPRRAATSALLGEDQSNVSPAFPGWSRSEAGLRARRHNVAHARCEAFSGLLRGKLCEQLARRPARHAPSGQFLYVVGEPAKSLYFLKSGLVKTSRSSSSGNEVILQLHRPGEILGELCFCTGERREQAVTLESSEVVEIARDELLGQLRRSPDIALDLVGALCERLGDVHGRLESLAFEPTVERLARTLLVLADTLGEETPQGTHIAHYVKQEELAQMIAARREVVSGLLNRLRERGLIAYSRKGAISVHRHALQAYVDALARELGK
jgi:CRP/FNR family transcriptional regulator, cyclic AMP receptor protein